MNAGQNCQLSYMYASTEQYSAVGEYFDATANNMTATSIILSEERATEYPSATARGNFLASDRVDITYAVKECARSMAAPTENDWNKLVRLARYLKGRPRLVV